MPALYQTIVVIGNEDTIWHAFISRVWNETEIILECVQVKTALKGLEKCKTLQRILQLFFLLVFLLSLRLGIDIGVLDGTRAFESIAAALVGIAGSWGWSYAIKNHRLLLPEVTKQYARRLKDRILAEPITAIITIPVAFIGPILWDISWLSYPLVVLLVRGRRRAKSD